MATFRTAQAIDELIRVSVERGLHKVSLLPLYANAHLRSSGGRPALNGRHILKNVNLRESTWAKLKKLARNVSTLTKYKVCPTQVVSMLLSMTSKKEMTKIGREISKRKLLR